MKKLKKVVDMQKKLERISNEFKKIGTFKDTCDEIMKLISLHVPNQKNEMTSVNKDISSDTQDKSKGNKMRGIRICIVK